MSLLIAAIECEQASRHTDDEAIEAIAKGLAVALKALEEISSNIDDIETRLSNIEYKQRDG